MDELRAESLMLFESLLKSRMHIIEEWHFFKKRLNFYQDYPETFPKGALSTLVKADRRKNQSMIDHYKGALESTDKILVRIDSDLSIFMESGIINDDYRAIMEKYDAFKTV